MTARGWCFTEFDLGCQPKWDEKTMKYLVSQLEECPETGRMHFQGFCEFNQSCRMAGAKKALGLSAGCHMESRKGTPQQAAEYCKKDESRAEDGGPWEYGKLPEGQGSRTDIKTLCDAIQCGSALPELARAMPHMVLRYSRGIDRLIELRDNKNQQRDVKVYTIIGRPGSGKTRRAFDTYPDIYTVASTSPEWWQGYYGQKQILIDDYGRGTAMPYERLLRVLDRYPLQLPIKGGFVPAKFDTVIITSNTHHDEWYPGRTEWDALERRICGQIFM